MEIKPIETEYGGYKFRSRLEARWAVFFNTANIKYEYETEGFELEDNTKYLPDFYLPEYDWYVEVKPPRNNAAEELEKAVKFVGGKIKALLILGNIPPKKAVDLWHYRVAYYDLIYGELTFARVCVLPDTERRRLFFSNHLAVDFTNRRCKAIALKWDFDGTINAVHDSDIREYSSYQRFNGILTEEGECLFKKVRREYCENLEPEEIELLAKCYDNARQARFEYGEKP